MKSLRLLLIALGFAFGAGPAAAQYPTPWDVQTPVKIPIATNTNIWSATINTFLDAAGANNSLNPVTLTDAATIALDMSTFINGTVTLGAAVGATRALGNPTKTQPGRCGFIIFTQDGSGSRALTYSSNWKFVNAVAPVLSTAAAAVDQLSYCVVDATHINASMMNNVK
jgi:hypothetical protein